MTKGAIAFWYDMIVCKFLCLFQFFVYIQAKHVNEQ